ncbi:hypothetical protein [Neptuniibacter sp.]|uniref:hypothetical protein n=1 Tax=Neptuniibacter sp. TaxID=1962643 RepID=UPI00261B3EBC|nr:hypothetical protein [Neptuniibacter sp.]MCP4598527.1 hypothetical protein [Neptuniibacter sp.]
MFVGQAASVTEIKMIRVALITITVIAVMLMMGCGSSSRIEVPIPGDGSRIIEGNAADDYVESLILSEKTARGRMNELFGSLTKMMPVLLLTMVGGFVFWGLTRSRFGWIIPAACVGGMIFIMVMARWAEWIAGVVVLIALAVLVWKAVEYRRERDDNAKN